MKGIYRPMVQWRWRHADAYFWFFSGQFPPHVTWYSIETREVEG